MTTSQDEYASKMKEMVKSHTAETAALREKFKTEMERKLVEQKEDMKVNNSFTTLHLCEFRGHSFMYDFIIGKIMVIMSTSFCPKLFGWFYFSVHHTCVPECHPHYVCRCYGPIHNPAGFEAG